MAETVGVLGTGSWGTAVALVLAERAEHVVLWGRNREAIEQLVAKRENARYLPGVQLPENIEFTNDLDATAKQATTVFSVVPSGATRDTAQKLSQAGLAENATVVSCAKGIELATGKTMGQVLEEELPGRNIAVFSGPNHAEEVARKQATASVIGATNPEVARQLQNLRFVAWLREERGT